MTFAAIVADVDRTIAHWRAIDLTADDISGQLRCGNKWFNIRRRMIRLALPLRMRVIENDLVELASGHLDYSDRRRSALRLAA